eukprot:gene8623-10613_t
MNHHKIVFIGNFVNDIIQIHEDVKYNSAQAFLEEQQQQQQQGKEIRDLSKSGNHRIIKNVALGGSVTYGSLAASIFGSTQSFIVTKVGSDINSEFESLIEPRVKNGQIHLYYSSILKGEEEYNTSYQLDYYNRKKNRTLSLLKKGSEIDVGKSIECISRELPSAIFLVPVAGELDEKLVIDVVAQIKVINNSRVNGVEYSPVVAFDIQGLLRTFEGPIVTTRPKNVMIEKLEKISRSLASHSDRNNIISVVKAEYAEASAILGDEFDPATCARLMREQFGFTITTVTMGGDGCFVSTKETGEIYVPTFKPKIVSDETGCGDTFLTCTVLELLNRIKENQQQQQQQQQQVTEGCYVSTELTMVGIKYKDIIHCIEVGSCGASFLVEAIGPNGFASRKQILDRVSNGERQSKSSYLKLNNPPPQYNRDSTTSPDRDNSIFNNNNQDNSIKKPFKSITHYK